MSNSNTLVSVFNQTPALVAASGARASNRFLEFLTARIRNARTCRAFARAASEFFDWQAAKGVTQLAEIERVHVATDIEQLTRERIAPTAKLRLAALRHLFDWMVIGQIMPINPAAAERGPRHIVQRGKTPVLDPAEARMLLDSIDTSTSIGLRDRALIALMVYSFARVGAALSMKIEDIYTRSRRLWLRLHEKGGKEHKMPCHHNLEEYLTAYIDGCGLRDDPKGPLFRTMPWRPTHAHGDDEARRLSNDRPARGGGRHRDEGRQSLLPRDRDHGVFEKQRHARKGRSDGEPRQHAHDAALRSPARRDEPRRGRADRELKSVCTPHQMREAVKRRDKDGETLRSIGRRYKGGAAMISRLMP